ncbi:hypothetical protein KY285_033396 [Solanum tuberosum]|nr:hypothetical protein KY285_033396 [Solanum tuberosum]
MAFSVPIECSSHNETEAKTSLYGCKWCIQNGYTNLNIELDSSLIVGMLTDEKANSFKLNKVIEDTSALLRQATTRFTHCYREDNQLVDWLAKMAMNSQASNIYVSYQQLPKGENGPYLMDK